MMRCSPTNKITVLILRTVVAVINGVCSGSSGYGVVVEEAIIYSLLDFFLSSSSCLLLFFCDIII